MMFVIEVYLRRYALLLTAVLVFSYTTIAFASPAVQRQITLPSGQHIKLLSISPVMIDGGKTKTILMKYLSDKKPDDKEGIAKEADDVWDLFILDAEHNGLRTAVLTGVLSELAAREESGTQSSPGQSITFFMEKNAQGLWFCRNDELVGIGTPAKVAYREGLQMFVQGRLKEALAYYNKSIALEPNYAQGYVDRGGLYLSLNELDKSLADSNKALYLMTDNAGAFCNRGIVCLKRSDYKKAIDDLTNAIRCNPNLGLAYADRGAAFIKIGEYLRAVADLSKAIIMQPKSGQAYYNRAIALEKLAASDRQSASKLGYQDIQPAVRP